jgi:hypothetical protein
MKINFGVSNAFNAGNTKIDFLKANLRLAFKKSTFMTSIAASPNWI